MTPPRGIRLNNPLNVRISSQKFQGEIQPSSDLEFKQFDCIENGIRCAARIILTYHNQDKINTISQIIYRWAPSSENPTSAYIQLVCDRTGFNEDASLNFMPDGDLPAILGAMIEQEQGGMCGITEDQVNDGVNRAFLV